MITADIIVIGAGPAGLFTVFEAGLLKLRCHLIDSLPQPGGQLKEIYPKKPIYDIPGFPIVNAGELVDRLMAQIAPFKPGFTLGESAQKIDETEEGNFIVTTNLGTQHKAPVVIIAGGLGVFEPRKPPVEKLEFFENKGVEYMVRDPLIYQNKKVIIAGGGDSALDWSIYLADNNIPSEITLVHRNNSFRGHLDSVQKVMDLSAAGKINLITEAEVIAINGDNHLNSVTIKHAVQGEFQKSADYFVPLFGLKPSLGPMTEWGLEMDKGSLVVNTKDYSTNRNGIFAVGDINTYDGKLKLILCGFHEATMAVQASFARIYPDKKQVLKYTTVNGINGF